MYPIKSVQPPVTAVAPDEEETPVVVEPSSNQVKENSHLKDCVMADVSLTDLPSNALSANRKSTFTRV